MASTSYIQHYTDGSQKRVRRIKPQGRKPRGLSDPELYRLYAETDEKLAVIKSKMGYLFNKNQIVRDAVKKHVDSVYTELLNT